MVLPVHFKAIHLRTKNNLASRKLILEDTYNYQRILLSVQSQMEKLKTFEIKVFKQILKRGIRNCSFRVLDYPYRNHTCTHSCIYAFDTYFIQNLTALLAQSCFQYHSFLSFKMGMLSTVSVHGTRGLLALKLG